MLITDPGDNKARLAEAKMITELHCQEESSTPSLAHKLLGKVYCVRTGQLDHERDYQVATVQASIQHPSIIHLTLGEWRIL